MKFISLLEEEIHPNSGDSAQKHTETLDPPRLNETFNGILKIPADLTEISWTAFKENPTEIVVRHLLSQSIHCQQTLLSSFVYLDGLRRHHTYEVSLRTLGPNGQASAWMSYLLEVI